VIGLDTNVLVRYLTLDDPAQSARATEILERELTRESPGFVSAVVVAELVWVLERAYRWDRSAIASAVEGLLQVEELRLEHEAEVYAAMFELRRPGADFADGLIGAIATSAGCSRTLTFDRAAQRRAGFAAA
jgi:predicted nucleic-acid-binding protein